MSDFGDTIMEKFNNYNISLMVESKVTSTWIGGFQQLKSSRGGASKKGFTLERYVKYLFVAPTIIYLLILLIFPTIFNIYISLHKWLIGMSPRFTGGENYVKLFTDSRFLNDVIVTFKFVIIAVCLEVGLGFLLALAAFRVARGVKIFRVLFIFPVMVAPIASGYMWRMLLHADYGVIPNLLVKLGFPRMEIISNPKLAFWGIILIDVWQWTPFVFLVIYAGLNVLPREPYEAALVDGASSWQIFRYITLPLISPIIFTVTLLRIIEAFKIFDIIYITTGGGPGIITESLSLYVYIQALKFFNLGYAASAAWIFFLMVMVLTTLYIMRLRKEMRM